jgi:hypothetical protein
MYNGNDKPPVIVDIETKIFSALYGIARGTMDVATAFQSFLESFPWHEIESFPSEIATWFVLPALGNASATGVLPQDPSSPAVDPNATTPLQLPLTSTPIQVTPSTSETEAQKLRLLQTLSSLLQSIAAEPATSPFAVLGLTLASLGLKTDAAMHPSPTEATHGSSPHAATLLEGNGCTELSQSSTSQDKPLELLAFEGEGEPARDTDAFVSPTLMDASGLSSLASGDGACSPPMNLDAELPQIPHPDGTPRSSTPSKELSELSLPSITSPEDPHAIDDIGLRSLTASESERSNLNNSPGSEISDTVSRPEKPPKKPASSKNPPNRKNGRLSKRRISDVVGSDDDSQPLSSVSSSESIAQALKKARTDSPPRRIICALNLKAASLSTLGGTPDTAIIIDRIQVSYVPLCPGFF